MTGASLSPAGARARRVHTLDMCVVDDSRQVITGMLAVLFVRAKTYTQSFRRLTAT
jgi:hypothetical protein